MATTPLFGNDDYGNDDYGNNGNNGNNGDDRMHDRHDRYATQPLPDPRTLGARGSYGEAAPPTRQLYTLRQTQPMLPEPPKGQGDARDARDIYDTPTLPDLAEMHTATMLRPELQVETQRGYLAMAMEHEATARVLRAQAYDIDQDVASMEHQCSGLSEDYDNLDAAVRRRVQLAPRWLKHYQWLAASIPSILQDIARYRNAAQGKLSRARDHEAAAAQLRLLAQQGA